MTLRASRIGIIVTCTVCHTRKVPVGRSAPPTLHFCRAEGCRGYELPPHAGSLWPGESEEDFGYEVGPAGTTDAETEVA